VDEVARGDSHRGRAAAAFRTGAPLGLERLESKLASLPPEARDRVDEITRLLVEKLLSCRPNS
jgi:hypothetical protein